ncbi:MAG: hypothetical protein V3V14_10895 [Saprospiraceae bacterium]
MPKDICNSITISFVCFPYSFKCTALSLSIRLFRTICNISFSPFSFTKGIRLDGVAFITQATHEKMKGTKVKAEDLLLNITGGLLVGVVLSQRISDTFYHQSYRWFLLFLPK